MVYLNLILQRCFVLNERIKELRLARNMSQVELAEKLGVSKQSVSNKEIIPYHLALYHKFLQNGTILQKFIQKKSELS